jgi:hypothetical protein
MRSTKRIKTCEKRRRRNNTDNKVAWFIENSTQETKKK